MRFGVREIANVTFRPLAALDIGRQHFSAWQPCLYIDTATASNMEVATTTVYAQGGRGNARLIAWEGEKTATFTVTDALLSPISFAMLSGAGVIDEVAGNKIIHLTVDGAINSGGTKIIVKKEDVAGYTLVASGGSGSEQGLNIYGMILDANGQVVDYLGDLEITQPTEEQDDEADWEISLVGTTTTYKDYPCRIDCYAKVNAPVTTLEIDAENFGGTFYIEAETLFRDEATGHDFPATFIIPKGKIQGNFTFNMAATGDPSTFDFTIDCTLGTVRTAKNKNKKMLYAIDIVDTIAEGAHACTATVDPVGGTGSIFVNPKNGSSSQGATGTTGQSGATGNSGELRGPTVIAGTSSGSIFGTNVADFQSNINIANNAITGTVSYLDSGDIANYWGNGYFLALHFDNVDNVAPENITVAGTPLDADLEGVWLIGQERDDELKKASKITIVTTDGEGHELSQDYDLTGLTFAPIE